MLTANAPNQWGTASYGYDPLDNLRTADMTVPGGIRQFRYNYGADNRLISISNVPGAAAYSFGYDTKGNITAKTIGAGCASDPYLQCAGKPNQALVFDSANRLSQVTGVQTYRYDGLGRRVQTTDADGKTTFWIYSQAGQVLHSSEARRGRNLSYIYLGNTQVATRAVAWGTGTVDIRYQHTDGLGTPVIETDASRTVTDRNNYTAWGEPWGTTTTDGTGYTGHVMDQGTGLTYMQQRYYDPVVGRFFSVDSLPTDPSSGFNFNRYNYALNNPGSFVDFDGRLSSHLCDIGGCNAGSFGGEGQGGPPDSGGLSLSQAKSTGSNPKYVGTVTSPLGSSVVSHARRVEDRLRKAGRTNGFENCGLTCPRKDGSLQTDIVTWGAHTWCESVPCPEGAKPKADNHNHVKGFVVTEKDRRFQGSLQIGKKVAGNSNFSDPDKGVARSQNIPDYLTLEHELKVFDPSNKSSDYEGDTVSKDEP